MSCVAADRAPYPAWEHIGLADYLSHVQADRGYPDMLLSPKWPIRSRTWPDRPVWNARQIYSGVNLMNPDPDLIHLRLAANYQTATRTAVIFCTVNVVGVALTFLRQYISSAG